MRISLYIVLLISLIGYASCGSSDDKKAKIVDEGINILDINESLSYIEGLLESDPYSSELLIKKAEMLYEIQEFDSSYQTLSLISNSDKDTKYKILEIQLNLQLDSVDRAIAAAEYLYNYDEIESIDLNEQLAYLYAEKRDFLKAIDHINYCIDKNGGEPKFSYLKGLYYYNFKDTVNAYQYIEKALNNGYEEMNGIILYSDLLMSSDKADKAYRMVNDYLQKEPENNDLRNALAKIYNMKEMYPDSKEISSRLIDEDAPGYGPYLNLADVYLDTYDYDSAIYFAEKALAIDDQLNEAYYILGKAHRAKEQVYNAYNAYSKVLEYDQGDPYALSEMQKLENYIAYLQRIKREYESRPILPILKPKSIEQ
jgi:tetratricopeptide (TPR) repeat protein